MQEDCLRLRDDYNKYYDAPDGKELFWEFIPLLNEHDRYDVEIRLCNKEDIMEIDNYYELQQLDPDTYH